MKNNEIHSSGVLKARRETLTLLCLGFLLLFAGSGSASAQIRRYALAAGANYGGPDRATLRYAVSDAESFARVMETLGGVYSSDLVLLKQPSLIELEDALEELRHKVDSSSESERTQIMVYYLRPRRRDRPPSRRRAFFVPQPSQLDGPCRRRRSHRRTGCLRIGGYHKAQGDPSAKCVPGGRFYRNARACVSHFQLRG